MINKYKKNIRTYIKKCNNCGSKFTFQYIDIQKLWANKSIECPYCETNLKIDKLTPMIFRKKYKKEINIINEYKLEIGNKQKLIDEYANQIHDIQNDKKLILYNHEQELNEIYEKLDKYKSSMTTTNNIVCGYINSLKIRKGNISKKEILSILDEIKTTLLK